jgi:hypothetical protein
MTLDRKNLVRRLTRNLSIREDLAPEPRHRGGDALDQTQPDIARKLAWL